MAGPVLRKFDERVRATAVLTEGVEHEFLKFVAHQEKFRKKWMTLELENHEMQKAMAKFKTDKETLEVKLKMARFQLDSEIKKRLKAEQSVDHMSRQLQLIKELILDKENLGVMSSAEKQALTQSIHNHMSVIQESRTDTGGNFGHSYTFDDSSIDLPMSEYDCSEDDILDATEHSILGDGRKGKRGRPSAPPLQPPTSTDEVSSEDQYQEQEYAKRTRISDDDSTEYTKKTTRVEEVHKTVESSNIRETRFSKSPSKYNATLDRLDREFDRPPRPENRRAPSRSQGHMKEFVNQSMSDSYDTDEIYDKEHPVEEMAPRTMSKQSTVPNLYPSLDGLGTPPKQKFNTVSGTPNSGRKKMLHSFVTKIAVRMETCGPCHKKLRFGSNVAKCKECKAVSHPECKDKIPLPCQPQKDTPSKKEGAIESYVDAKKSPKIPDIVTQCIEEIENRGLKEQGIYRVPGSDKDIRELKEKFLRKKNPDLHKYKDIHVVCGCLKDFLRGLSEPLVTFSLHESFTVAAGTRDADDSLSAMYQCISELPQANRETLAALIVHLQKVSDHRETQMNISNLAKVFGPTIVGHRSPNPTHIEMLEDTKAQSEVVTRLLEIPADYWNQYGNIQTIKTPPYNPNFKSTNTTTATPYDAQLNTPTTPECKPVPESMLGPLDPNAPSSRKKVYSGTPRVESKGGKRQRHFFNSPS